MEMLVSYVVLCRGRGPILPYTDYDILRHWLELAGGQVDLVLLTLSELLPSYFEKKSQNNPPSLQGLHKKFIKKMSRIMCTQAAV